MFRGRRTADPGPGCKLPSAHPLDGRATWVRCLGQRRTRGVTQSQYAVCLPARRASTDGSARGGGPEVGPVRAGRMAASSRSRTVRDRVRSGQAVAPLQAALDTTATARPDTSPRLHYVRQAARDRTEPLWIFPRRDPILSLCPSAPRSMSPHSHDGAASSLLAARRCRASTPQAPFYIRLAPLLCYA